MKSFIAILSLLVQSLWPQAPALAPKIDPNLTHPAPLAAPAAPLTTPLATNLDRSMLRRAAAENQKLGNSMNWDFAGTRQHGWYLYVPIIDELIGSQAAIDSDDFAA